MPYPDVISSITALFRRPERLGRFLQRSALDPFRFQTQRCGLTWGGGRVTLTIVGRSHRGGGQIIDTVSAPLEDTRHETLAVALGHLREARPEHPPPAILGLDSTVLSYRLLMPPDPLPADIAEWVVAQTPRLAPPGLRLADMALDFRTIQTGERIAIQVVWARRDRLAALTDLVEAAGFCVAGVYPSPLAVVEHQPFADTSEAVIVWSEESITYAPCTDGVAQHLHEIAWASPEEQLDVLLLIERMTHLMSQPSPQIRITTSSLPEETISVVKTFAEELEHRGIQAETAAGPDDASAVALAGVHPSQPLFQLLPDRSLSCAQQEQDRRRALRIAWGGGAVAAVSFLISFVLGWYYTHEQRILTQELTARGAWIAEVRMLARTEQALSTEVAALRALQAGRAGVAGLLESLGRAVPEQVWLRTVRLRQQAENAPYEAQITGLARHEEGLVAFLARLHDEPAWHPKDAFTTTRLDPAAVQRQAGARTPLIRFELTLVAEAP